MVSLTSPHVFEASVPSASKKLNGWSVQSSSAGLRRRCPFHTAHSRSMLQWCSQKMGSRAAVSGLPMNPPMATWMSL